MRPPGEASARYPEPGLEGLARLAASITRSPVAAINLVTSDGMSTEVGLGMPRGPLPEGAFCLRIAATGQPLAVTDAATDRDWQAMAAAGFRGYLGVPVAREDGVVLGTLCVLDPGPRTFDAEVRAQLAVLAEAAAAYLELRRTHEELQVRLDERGRLLAEVQRLSRTDPLTGTLNRRGLDEALVRETARAARTGRGFSIVLLDLDHFKAYNDAHGHPAGDRMLQQCAAAWEGAVRRGDELCRYGGEEFAVLATTSSMDGAIDLADRLRKALPVGVTASAGVATWARGDTPDALIGRADGALYAAKAAGRNRTVTAGQPVAAA